MSKTETAGTGETLADAVANELAGRNCQEEAITSGELSDRLDVGDGEANPKTREIITDLIEERNMPIIAGHCGYWVAADMQEIEDYLDDLDGRIAGIQQRKQRLVAAYNRRRYADE